MEVTQIYETVNSITNEVLGKSDILKEDLSNIVDVGTELFSATSVDNYVKSLVNRIGKVVFVNRTYKGRVPSVVMDAWQFGSVLEKLQADLPQATENETWDLVDGQSYDENIFYKPSVSAKFFNSKITFEIPLSFTERQVRESFGSPEELNAFLSMLYNSVEKSMTLKTDALVMRTINNMIAQTYSNDTDGNKAINLLARYNENNDTALTVDKCLTDSDFLRYATMTISLYVSRFATMSTIFNVGGKPRFTPKDYLHLVMLSDFIESSRTYLQADTIHRELLELPNSDTVPFWQASGDSFDFEDVSKINVTIKDNATTKDVAISGILAVMFDRDALGVSNLDRRVTTHYNAKAEFFNNWYKFDAGYYNDLNENFVFFYVADTSSETSNVASTRAKK